MKEVNDTICAALVEIPDTLTSTDRVVALFQSHGFGRDLHHQSAKLLASVLVLLGLIVHHVNRSRTSTCPFEAR